MAVDYEQMAAERHPITGNLRKAEELIWMALRAAQGDPYFPGTNLANLDALIADMQRELSAILLASNVQRYRAWYEERGGVPLTQTYRSRFGRH